MPATPQIDVPESESTLEKARRHVREGERRIAKQAALVARLRADGHDVSDAERLLDGFVALMLVFRNHLANEEATSYSAETIGSVKLLRQAGCDNKKNQGVDALATIGSID